MFKLRGVAPCQFFLSCLKFIDIILLNDYHGAKINDVKGNHNSYLACLEKVKIEGLTILNKLPIDLL